MLLKLMALPSTSITTGAGLTCPDHWSLLLCALLQRLSVR
jgi:hypothetical protein